MDDVVESLQSSNDLNNCPIELSDNTFKSTSNAVKRINGHGTTYSKDGLGRGVRANEEVDNDSQAMLCEKQAEECVNLLRSLSENCVDELNFSEKSADESLNEPTECLNESGNNTMSDVVIEDSSDSNDSVSEKAEDECENNEDQTDNITTNIRKTDSGFRDECINGRISPECSADEDQRRIVDDTCKDNGIEMRGSNIDSPVSETNDHEMETDAALSLNDDAAMLEKSNKNTDSLGQKCEDGVDKNKGSPEPKCHDIDEKLDVLETDTINDTDDKQIEPQSQPTDLSVHSSVITSKNNEQPTRAETPSSDKAPKDSGDISGSISDAPRPIPCVSESVSETPQTSSKVGTLTSSVIPGVPQKPLAVKPPAEQGKVVKAAKVKAPSDNVRPVGRILQDLGLDIVRQEVYKDLIDIQEGKDSEKKLSDTEKGQLVKLTEAHSKLKSKNSPYYVARKRCSQCRYNCTTRNAMQLHYEYGQYSHDDWHVCCLCDFRTRFPSQFITHMETVHLMSGRLVKKLTVRICPYCPYENKKSDKVELHAAKCTKKFILGANLQPLPSDCDIAIRYKPASWPQQGPPGSSAGGLTSGFTRPPGPGGQPANQPSNVMEIGGKMYSMANQRGKQLLSPLQPLSGRSPVPLASRPNFISGMPMNRGGPLPSGTRPNPPYTIRPQHEQTIKSPPAIQNREKCEVCGVGMTNRQVLFGHLRGVHKIDMSHADINSKGPCVACEMCKARFWTYQGMAKHSMQMHKRVSNTDAAGRVEATLPVFPGLRAIRPSPVQQPNAQGSSPVFRCTICGVSQASLNPLNHLSTHHNITLLTMYEMFRCYICDRKLRSSVGFEDHMVTMHGDIFANIEVLRTVLQALLSAQNFKSNERQMPRPVSAISTSRPQLTPQQMGRYMNPNGGGLSQQRPQYVMNSHSAAAQMMGTKTQLMGGNGMRAPLQQYSTRQPQRPLLPSLPGYNYIRQSSSTGRYRAPMIASASGAGPAVHKKPRNTAQVLSPPVKTPEKKTVEEVEQEEKVLNKLYEEYADIGRPISRAMKQKLLTASPGAESVSAASKGGKDEGKSKLKRVVSNVLTDGNVEVPMKKQCVSPPAPSVNTEDNTEDNVVKKDNVVDTSLQTIAPIV